MHVRCECGATASDFLSKLRASGWSATMTAASGWACPTCVFRREVMPTVSEMREPTFEKPESEE